MTPRILIVGTGAIGGTLAGHLLANGGTEVVALSSNERIAEAVRAGGFRRVEPDGEGVERVNHGSILTTPGELEGRFDWILLATPPDAVVEAACSVAARLADGGALVVMQNGLCEERVARALREAELPGADSVLGAIVGFGASMPEPGVFERTSEGGFTLGRMDGADDPRLDALAELLEPIGPVEMAGNFAGARWSKLAINCAISTLGTLAGAQLGRVLRLQRARRLALEIMTEVVRVARAEGVTLEKVSGTLDLDWIALSDEELGQSGSVGLVAKHALLLAVGARYRRLRSSMLAALERGRTPPVDFLNGEIVARADAHGLEAPVNAAATVMIHEMARGDARPSIDKIEELARRTAERPSSRPAMRL